MKKFMAIALAGTIVFFAAASLTANAAPARFAAQDSHQEHHKPKTQDDQNKMSNMSSKTSAKKTTSMNVKKKSATAGKKGMSVKKKSTNTKKKPAKQKTKTGNRKMNGMKM